MASGQSPSLRPPTIVDRIAPQPRSRYVRRTKRNRDITNFLTIREGQPGDDRNLGEFLVRVFTETYREKLPQVSTSAERISDLMDVITKRRSGVVCVLELGYKIVGSFSLIHPDAKISDAWLPNSATLRCVAVDKEYHGLGFSELLLREAHRRAASWGMESVCLHVQKGADKVAALYEQVGYKRDPRGDKIDRGQDIIGYLRTPL